MKYVFLILLLPFLSQAQDSIDPEAKVILDGISEKLNSAESISLKFDLLITFPGSDEDIQSGFLQQKGDNFKVTVEQQEILSNGKEVYMIDKDAGVAQLNSMSELEEGQGVMNPKEMLTLYNSGDYYYAITGEDDYEGKRVINIEFKPKDRYSEYSKLRMAVDKVSNEPMYLTLFNKDGSKFTIRMKSIDYTSNITDGIFIFNDANYPNIDVEDLRID